MVFLYVLSSELDCLRGFNLCDIPFVGEGMASLGQCTSNSDRRAIRTFAVIYWCFPPLIRQSEYVPRRISEGRFQVLTLSDLIS